MAVVKGIKERVHLPIYDCIRIEPEKQLRDVESSSTLKFFMDVQGKTKLETNLQSAGLLPHYNTFEARAMRVVISDLPPKFPDEPIASDEDFTVSLDDLQGNPRDVLTDPVANVPPRFYRAGTVAPDPLAPPAPPVPPAPANTIAVVADVELDLADIMARLTEAREGEGETYLDADDEAVTLRRQNGAELAPAEVTALANLGGYLTLTTADLEALLQDGMEDEKLRPPQEQISPANGSGNLIGSFVYNTVTTFFVGEKIMIQMPTWFFPAGAGPYSQQSRTLTHGEPNPTATFRFAEPIFIEKQQNFRVEIEVPDSDTLKEIQRAYGPMSIWVVLDGYMTRNVQ